MIIMTIVYVGVERRRGMLEILLWLLHYNNRLHTILKISRYQVAHLSTLRHWPKSPKNCKIGQIALKLKSRPRFKVYLVNLLIGGSKNWAILQKMHLQYSYDPKFHWKLYYEAKIKKIIHQNHFCNTFNFSFY